MNLSYLTGWLVGWPAEIGLDRTSETHWEGVDMAGTLLDVLCMTLVITVEEAL